MSNNKFNTSILFVSYQEFINEKNKGTFRKLAKKYNIYEIINCNNKEVFLKLGKKSNEIIYKFYDKDFKLFVEKKLPQNFIYDLKFLQLNLLKTEKFYKFEEFITLIRRGYSMAELLNSGAKYSKEGISYITNSNISRGFLDKSQAKLSFVKANLTLVKKDDLVISKSPPYKIALIEDDKQYLANDNLFIIKIDKNKIDPAYIWSYLQSKKAQKIIIKNQKDTKNLSIKMLKNMEITIYDSEKMGKIRCEFLKNINILKNSYKKIEDISKTNEEIFE
ncbi:restriction endonuclease subunit S [Anaerococcus ihuae]|uniref:restriction endonuclease subunit S n=1 Tax=Anaerococcus ihuae TaxID=2899519 RepID=UPI001EFF905B|nr:restriction endonuclease subunit S [Anaerococcus ihuae]